MSALKLASEAKVNILLVDDQPAGLVALENTLQPLGQNLVKARSGRDALRELLKTEFAVALLDVVMPDLDGFETAQLIREHRTSQDLPIIFLTAADSGELPEFRAYSMGAVDYVLKPYQGAILRSKVSVFVDLAKKNLLLRQTNEQLREAHRLVVTQQLKLVQSEKLASVGLLAAGVAHEINNPLMGVLSCLALLKNEQTLQHHRQVYFDAISTALDQIGATVRALLGYAREQPAVFTSVDVADFVSTCLPLLTPLLRTRNVEVVQNIAPGTVFVRGNGSQLSQAAMNVLLNAVQASPPGGRVAVTTMTEGDRVGVRFEDHGEGIPSDKILRVCDPFFTTKPEGEGTGLGLSVTQGILTAHGGELAISSEAGRGTVVTLWLPTTTQLEQALRA